MSRVLVIGCGGVASVAIQKCCQVDEVFTEMCIASRTKEKCDALVEKLKGKTKTVLTTAKVDADDVDQLIELINSYKPDLVMSIALPYQDLTIMDACLACGVNYMDTANYEPEDTDDPEWRAIYEKRCKEEGFSAYFDYSWQWAYRKKFEDAGLTALLGCGFDPGVTQAYCAYALKHEFDQIDTIDILDCNGGDHGYAFATNFNPEMEDAPLTNPFKKHPALSGLLAYAMENKKIITVFCSSKPDELLTGYVETYDNKKIKLNCVDMETACIYETATLLKEDIFYLEVDSLDNELLKYANEKIER